MGTYNLSKIEGWLKDFTSAKDRFTNTYYSDYKNSYIRSCNDSAVVKMRNKLNEHYARISKINSKIKTVWDDFLWDLKVIDNRLAGGKGNANDSSVGSKLSKLPSLKEYKANLSVRINSASAVVGTVDKIGWSEDKTLSENLDYFGTRAVATIDTAVISLVEGVGIFGEGLVDTLAVLGTTISSGAIYIQGFIEDDMDGAKKLSEEIWEDSRAFTSKQYVKSTFDNFYENNPYGQCLKENAFGFDTVRSIGNEVGEVVGAVSLSAVTGGAINPAVLYGASKVGTHVEENWQDKNTSTAAGLVKGTLQGIGDGAFFALGMKGDAVMKSMATNAVKKGGQQVLKKATILTGKTLYESGCSVAQDGTNILINAIFSDDIVQTQDGKTVKLNSFSDKLNFYYEQAGGMEGLMTSMATAGVLSFASDFVDVSKVGKNINTNAAIKNTDINANNMKNTIEGINPKNIEVSSNVKKANVNDNLDALKSGKQDLSHIENPINLKNTDLNKNITSRNINSNLSKMQSLPKTLAGIFTSVPAAITKMKNVDITPGSKLFKKIQSEGLYHFTNEVSAKKILDSGYIKESSNFTSYGKKRTFLFAGVPTVEDTCLNSVFDYKKTAVKLHPSDAEISRLQYRKYSDSAVSSIGNYDITNSSPEIAYLVLKEQDGVLKYVEVPKAEYDNYNPHFNDNVINKTVENAKKKIYQATVGISADYDNVVKGVKQYAGDLKDKLAPKKVFADYDGNLKEYIFDNIPHNLNTVEKARYIYCKLNNEVSYSKLWNSTKKVSGIDTDAVYNQKINIESFLGQEIVCSNWSEMYHELLDTAGVENYIRGIDGKHKWVVFTENGKYYMADATNNFNRAPDLARMQGNVQSGGFFEITKEQFYSDTFANELANKKNFNGLYEKTLSDSNLNLKKIDKKLGFNYEDSEKLFGEGLHQGNSSKELKRLGLNKNSSMEEIINAKLEKELFNKINNMGVLEAYGYTNIVKNRFFTGMEQGKLRCTLVADAVTGEESIMYRVINGKNYLYNGKGVFVEIDNDFAINYENHGYVKIAGN